MEYRFATRGGGALYVEETGSGPAVLAIHGLGGGAYFFHGLAKRLDGRFRFLSIDLPGTGRSSVPNGEFSLESWVADLGELLAEKIAAPAVLLGHSLGTILALKMWEARPESVRAMIFAGGLPRVIPDTDTRLSRRCEIVEREGLAGMGAKATPAIFAASAFRERPETVGLFERLFEAQDPAAYVRSARILLGASAASVLPTVRVPCLVVGGREDQYAPPEAVDAFARELPSDHRRVILPDCGHVPFFEAPDAFAVAVSDFLDSLF